MKWIQYKVHTTTDAADIIGELLYELGIQGFEVAGADGKFHRAAARYDWHDGIIVSSEKVAVPRAVRYCFRNFMLGNARNQGGLPLIPFRATVK